MPLITNHSASLSAYRARGGFSLVELLVAISIIALLISIMLPSLSQAREHTRKLTCMSNQRAVAQGAHFYAADNKGFGPPSSYNGAYQWHEPRTTSYTDIEGKTYPPVTGLAGYFGYDDTMSESARFYNRRRGCANYSASFVGNSDGNAYAGNHYVLGLANTTVGAAPVRDFWVRLDDGRVNGVIVALYVESYHGQATDFGHLIVGRPNNPYRWAVRHADGLNVTYVDGHAKFTRFSGHSFADDTILKVPNVTR